jgi:hypothetical protein
VPEEPATRPAFYAARPGTWRDWWTLLHPPYTAWHLAYVVIGASLATRVRLAPLVATILAFFLAVGVSAHAFDELHGRPLRTGIPSRLLVTAAVIGLVGAVTIGLVGVARMGWPIVPFLVVGPLLVVGYNVEFFGGILHNDTTFAIAWGGFPLLTAYVAQTGSLALAPVVAAAAACALSAAQRQLSTPARLLRRRAVAVTGEIVLSDGSRSALEREVLLAPLERALRSTAWAVTLVAAALAIARLT